MVRGAVLLGIFDFPQEFTMVFCGEFVEIGVVRLERSMVRFSSF
jgi:hypothetical protein